MAEERFQPYRDELVAFCRRNRIRRLSIFGSALRADFGPDSDIDVLVEFEAGHVPGLEFFGMAEELSQLFGRRVDFVTERGLNRHIRERVLDEARPLYDAA
ncbi:MAG: nucleotidyltransferase family protein [Dehalococcoidia bacterium]